MQLVSVHSWWESEAGDVRGHTLDCSSGGPGVTEHGQRHRGRRSLPRTRAYRNAECLCVGADSTYIACVCFVVSSFRSGNSPPQPTAPLVQGCPLARSARLLGGRVRDSQIAASTVPSVSSFDALHVYTRDRCFHMRCPSLSPRAGQSPVQAEMFPPLRTCRSPGTT
jgi:hypothetical protein